MSTKSSKLNINIKCDDCIFCDKGYCRRFPPQAFQESVQIVQSVFPTVDLEDWCGEHQIEICSGGTTRRRKSF